MSLSQGLPLPGHAVDFTATETHSGTRSSRISAVTYLSVCAHCRLLAALTLALILSSRARNVTHAGSSREICPIECSSSPFPVSRACLSAGAGREAGCSLQRAGWGCSGRGCWSPALPAELPDLPAGPPSSSPSQGLLTQTPVQLCRTR